MPSPSGNLAVMSKLLRAREVVAEERRDVVVLAMKNSQVKMWMFFACKTPNRGDVFQVNKKQNTELDGIRRIYTDLIRVNPSNPCSVLAFYNILFPIELAISPAANSADLFLSSKMGLTSAISKLDM